MIVLITVSTTCSISGHLALKKGMSIVGTRTGSLLVNIAKSPWVVGGLLGYGFGVLFWLMALSRVDVSYLYPFASLSYVGVTIGSHFLFKERITPLRFIGISIVILGLVIAGVSV